MEGQWKQRRGKAVHHWGKTMNDELSAILGKYEELVGNLQEKYGIAKDEARRRMDDYKIIVEQLKQANSKLIMLHKALSIKKKSD
jgi:CsbD-like.